MDNLSSPPDYGSRYDMKEQMDALLDRITQLYTETIPAALQSAPEGLILYGGFIPYFGWEADPKPCRTWKNNLYLGHRSLARNSKKDQRYR